MNKPILITGATSGIGQATTRALSAVATTSSLLIVIPAIGPLSLSFLVCIRCSLT